MHLTDDDLQMLKRLHDALEYHQLMASSLTYQMEQVLLVKYGVKVQDNWVLDLDKGRLDHEQPTA